MKVKYFHFNENAYLKFTCYKGIFTVLTLEVSGFCTLYVSNDHNFILFCDFFKTDVRMS